MYDGFIRVAAATPDIRVADCDYNCERIIECIRAAAENKARIIVLPELCVTGYTCSDLFFQSPLLDAAKAALKRIRRETADIDALIFIGVPAECGANLYNTAAAVYKGELLGLIPKKNIPNYSEFYEKRHFSEGPSAPVKIDFDGEKVMLGTNILIKDKNMPGCTVAAEICEDLWAPVPPSSYHAVSGATLIVNLSASNELIAKSEYRAALVSNQSARLWAGYIYCSAGEGESTTDLVFGGDNIIAENGAILARSKKFRNQNVYADIDLGKIASERRKNTSFKTSEDNGYFTAYTAFALERLPLLRKVGKTPFVPSDKERIAERAEEILSIQSLGLKKRVSHACANTAVIGISGGLDSTLALLVAVRAFDMLKRDRADIIAVTMPCFGTTSRTYANAVNFARSLGVTFKEVNIAEAVTKHFSDIEQDPECYDVTYENSQARERTQVLMDIANKTGGLVIGTGDLSELALGWATYNGDHMSMYAVNASVPKTLIRYLVAYEAERTDSALLKKTLKDILDTPVSPELLPPKDGKIAQKTEHIVGPYELHDFFLFYMIRFGFAPGKILRLAEIAFSGEYTRDFILEWEKVFYRRFFTQQFKRSCIPDGPKVGSVALSPRGDWRMPSDASSRIWMKELELL